MDRITMRGNIMSTTAAFPIDITTEALISPADAARRLPPFRRGRPVHPSCVLRWIADGIRLRDGSRLRLAAVRIGARWLTSVEALERFVRAQTPRPADAPPPRTPVQRQRAAERAGKALEALGI
jgi:hypothetical protein